MLGKPTVATVAPNSTARLADTSPWRGVQHRQADDLQARFSIIIAKRILVRDC